MYTDLYTQVCTYTGEAKIKYYQVNKEGYHELAEGLFMDLICSRPEMPDSNFLYTDVTHSLVWDDPDASTPQGIRFFLFQEIPNSSSPSPEEFLEKVVLSEDGAPLAFEPKINLRIKEYLHVGRLFYLIPVLVNNITGSIPEELFEGQCIKLLNDNTLKLYIPWLGSFEYAEKEGVGLIRFPYWSKEIAITKIMDITVRDEYRNPVSFTLYDNRTIRLHLTRKDGFYDFILQKINSGCLSATFLSYPYPLPLVRLRIDSVSGFRGREVCIPVTARNMNSITDFTMPFYFHQDSLKFAGLQNIHPLLAPVIEGAHYRLGDYEVLSLRPWPGWNDTLIIPNGAVLFEICVTPLVTGPASIPISTIPPGPNGDSLRFEIIGIEADHVANTGIVRLPDDNRFLLESRLLCSETPGHFDLELNIFGHSAPYTYSFPGSEIPDSTFSDSVIIIRDIPYGRRDLNVSNRFGSTSAGYIDVSPESLSGRFIARVDSASVLPPSCGKPLGQVPLSVTPSHGNYQFLWVEGKREFTEPLMTGIPPGLHTFRITDENHCSLDLSYDMQAASGLTLAWDEEDLVLCPGEEKIPLNLKIPTPNYHLQIDDGDTLVPSDSIILKQGAHSLSVWDGSCRIDTTLFVSKVDRVRIDPPLPEEVHLSTEISLQFTVRAKPELWDARWIFHGEVVSDSFILDWFPPGNGILFFEASFPPGCVLTDSVRIILPSDEIMEKEFSLPNAFSPNADGFNDFYSIPLSEGIVDVSEFQIFDRYGSLIYEGPKQSAGSATGHSWDGNINGQEASPGVYIVKAVLHLANGESEEMVWTIQLIR